MNINEQLAGQEQFCLDPQVSSQSSPQSPLALSLTHHQFPPITVLAVRCSHGLHLYAVHARSLITGRGGWRLYRRRGIDAEATSVRSKMTSQLWLNVFCLVRCFVLPQARKPDSSARFTDLYSCYLIVAYAIAKRWVCGSRAQSKLLVYFLAINYKPIGI